MKYELEIELDLPLGRVIALFDNPDNLAQWQEGFISFEPLEGEPGAPGSTSKICYKMGSRDVEMTETIQKRDLPAEFSATYEAKSVWNLSQNFFEEIDANKTRWKTQNEFKCSGVMKVLTFTMPGMFKKQTLKSMHDFKAFAESQTRD